MSKIPFYEPKEKLSLESVENPPQKAKKLESLEFQEINAS